MLADKRPGQPSDLVIGCSEQCKNGRFTMNVKFVSAVGAKIELMVEEGVSLMEAAVQGGIGGIDADCGGQLSCATCHIYLDETWLSRVPPPESDEEDMLDFAVGRDARSRLSCQIIMDASLDGLVVHVPESQA
jgi:2Fe-2S ferredoxin